MEVAPTVELEEKKRSGALLVEGMKEGRAFLATGIIAWRNIVDVGRSEGEEGRPSEERLSCLSLAYQVENHVVNVRTRASCLELELDSRQE